MQFVANNAAGMQCAPARKNTFLHFWLQVKRPKKHPFLSSLKCELIRLKHEEATVLQNFTKFRYSLVLSEYDL